MTPLYLNSPPSPFHLIELKEDQQQQQQMQFFSSTGPPQHQPSSSLSSPIVFNITQDQRASDHSIEPQKDNEYIMLGASSDHRVVIPASSSIHGTVESSAGDNSGLSICKVEDEVEDKRDYESAKWMMSKKIRIVQKMMSTGSHEKQERIIKIKFPDLAKDKCEINSPSNCGTVVRICSDCKTSKTPLWRSGPQGPKSLCNACGIRQRKARRAMLAAAAAANGTVDVTTEDNSKTKTKVQKKEKKSSSSYHMTQFKIAAVAAANGTADVTTEDNSKTKTKVQKKEKKSRSSYHMTQFKKAFGTPQGDREKISFEDFALSLSKSLAFRRVFPKDEEEAAILLMALSCGLLHS